MIDLITLGKMMLVLSIVSYIFYLIYQNSREQMIDSLFRALRTIADSQMSGEAPESTIKRIADMKNERCSTLFREIVQKIDSGKTFGEAIETVSKTKNYEILSTLGEILIEAQKTGADLYETTNSYSQKLYVLKSYEKYAKKSTSSNIMVTRLMIVIVLPFVYYFFPFILPEITIPYFTFYFFAGFGVVVAFMDYFVYNDFVKSVIFAPMFASIPLLLPWALDYVNIF